MNCQHQLLKAFFFQILFLLPFQSNNNRGKGVTSNRQVPIVFILYTKLRTKDCHGKGFFTIILAEVDNLNSM